MKAQALEELPKIIGRELQGMPAAYFACLLGCKLANCLTTGFFFLFFTCAVAPAQVHPPEPGVNLGDTNFLDGLAGPGWLVQETADVYHSEKIAGPNGRTTPASPPFNVVASLTQVAYVTKHRMFHAWWGTEVIPVAASVHASDLGNASGVSTVIVSPFILQWSEWKIGRVRMQQRVDFDFFLPIGEYQQISTVNASSHFWSANPYYSVTVFPAKHWETSWRIHYLYNGVNHEPPRATGLSSTQAGQAIHFNATLGYMLPHGIIVGANGYYLKQITDPRVNGMQLPYSPEQVGAIGPGALWDSGGDFMLCANAYHEFGAVNRTEGNKLVLRLSWLPGRKTARQKAN